MDENNTLNSLNTSSINLHISGVDIYIIIMISVIMCCCFLSVCLKLYEMGRIDDKCYCLCCILNCSYCKKQYPYIRRICKCRRKQKNSKIYIEQVVT